MTAGAVAQASPATWDWDIAQRMMPELLRGLSVTLQATLVGITVAMVLGLVLAMARRSSLPVVRWPVVGFIEFVRSTPLLVQLFFLFFVLPDLGVRLSGFTAGVLGLGLHYATYTSEAYRSGIENVEKGQWEAAVACNLSTRTTWGSVVLPQAIPTVIPALGNYLVAMLKDAPLLSTIAVLELLAVARQLNSQLFRPLEAFSLAALLFLAVSIPAAILVRYLEKRYGYSRE
ncbi:MAG: ectoine/hydroxyectoine ABC transporter permease subunit EhuD [Actinobacteria bacterium]|nr:ectoine/hydroxyectoine ABC transporter permease subunit EhuD [Actinomycetota bacterium]